MRRIVLASLLLLAAATFAGPSAGFSYMLSRDGNSIISGNVDIRRIESMHGRWDVPYLWARIDGREYVTHDAGVMAEARAAFAEVDALHVQYQKIHDRMRPLERREEKLEDRIDSITDAHSDDGADIDEEELARLERELETVSRQLRALEEEEERIDEREEQLTAVAEKNLRAIIDRAIARGVARRAD
jgi:DNA repair exonuclease SbcCD ATPase subunit